MKTLVIFSMAFALILCSNSFFAQDSKLSLGLKLKPTISWLGGLNSVTDKRLSYSAGIISEYSLSSKLSIKSGISFERKGSIASLQFTDSTGMPSGPFDVTYNYDYLVVPVLASFSTKGNGKVKVYFDGGPYICYLLSHKVNVGPYGTKPETTIDYSYMTKRIDLGLSLGTGLSVALTNSLDFDLGLDANLGLINSRKYNSFNTVIRPNSLGLTMALKYRL
jgi:hypothetical protein